MGQVEAARPATSGYYANCGCTYCGSTYYCCTSQVEAAHKRLQAAVEVQAVLEAEVEEEKAATRAQAAAAALF